jgi:CelD/BcsL family acetyltransferase involved in cellulose biosynthesis
MLSVQEFDSPDGPLPLREEWTRLASAVGGSLPFAKWEWHDAWWREFRRDWPHVHDSLCIRAFRTTSGQLVGIAPMMLTRRPSTSLLAVRVLDFMGGNLTELRGVLCDHAWEADVYAALMAYVTERAGDWDWVNWGGLLAGSPGEQVITAHRGVRVVEERHCYVLALPRSWEEFLATRGRNVKESIRKCYNSLRRDGLAFTFEVAERPDEVPRALDRFFALHRARAAQRNGERHADVFSTPAARRFLIELCGRLAPAGGVRIFQLRIGTEIVASRVAFVTGGSLYFYFSGYDPRWARYSVMTTTFVEAIKYAIGAGIGSVNLSFGGDTSKTRWRPEQLTYRTAIQESPSLRGRVAHFAWRSVEALTRQSWRALLGSRARGEAERHLPASGALR